MFHQHNQNKTLQDFTTFNIHIVICIRTLRSLLGEYKLSEQIIAFILQGKYVGPLGYTTRCHKLAG